MIVSSDRNINENSGGRNWPILRVIFTGGLLGVLFIAPFLRGLYFEQELLPILMLLALFFTCCVWECFYSRSGQWFKNPLDGAMLALVFAYLLSLLNAVHMRQALIALLSVTAFFMVYWMAGRAIKNDSDFKRLLLAVYLSGIGLAMVGLGAAAGLINMPAAYEDGHIRSALQYHNTLAIYLAGLSFAGLALSLGSGRRLSRLAYAAGNLLLLIVIMGAISRGTWLLYPFGFMLFIFLISKQYRSEALLNWAIFFFYGLAAGLGFLNSISQGKTALALGFVLAGLLIVIFMQWLADINKLVVKSAEGDKKPYWFIGRPQFLGSGLVLMAALLCMLLSFPGTGNQVVPKEMSAKVEKTSLQDNSIHDRLTFYQDALKIAVDYPLLGAGGGGWEALYHGYAQRLYWSREVHSYYLQTLVEAGSLGLLALLAIAGLFSKLLFDFRQRSTAGSLSDIYIWGGTVAVVMIGMHSAFDADFSLPSTGLLFYALIGAITGRIMIENSSGRKPKKDKGESNKITAGNRAFMPAILAMLMALLVFWGAGAFYRAAQLAEAGAQALEEREAARAATLYQRAAKLDPWRASYQINLARIEAVKDDKYRDTKAHQAARGYAARAAELEPYNSKVQRALVDIYGALREGDLRIAASQALVKANPLLEQSYEILAGSTMDAAWYFLRSGQRKPAASYFTQVLAIREKLPPGAGQPGAALNLLAGQAAVCLGKIEDGQGFLKQVLKSENENRADAQLWLAAAATLAGDHVEANSYLKQLFAQDKAAPAKFQAIIKLLALDSGPRVSK